MERFIYGPVPSRRLGLSLGVDLVGHKICSYDCIYCQLGRTRKKTVERRPYVPIEKIILQLEQRLNEKPHVDFITLGGSGEPTLNSHINTLITELKRITSIPIAVLTNGSLLSNKKVRDALMKADVILPSLDAHDQKGFDAINRPHPKITFDVMLEGLITFRKAYEGQLWLEIMILKGINDSNEDALAFKGLIEKIMPDRIHINTAVRPPAVVRVRQADIEQMSAFCEIFGKNAEIIAPFRAKRKYKKDIELEDELLNVLARRPCTLGDLSDVLSVNQNKIAEFIHFLIKSRKIEAVKKGPHVYYRTRA
jgi:wyosine [tRNA(Phe)-imidazoG37] synthetase (radical SAM superfamily)